MFEPVPGSLMAVKTRRSLASSGSRNRFFCAAVPSLAILWIGPFVMLSMVRSDSQVWPASSISMAQVIWSRPMPPSDSGRRPPM